MKVKFRCHLGGRVPFLALSLALSIGCVSASDIARYDVSGNESEPSGAYAPALRSCIRNWESVEVQRVEIPDGTARSTGAVLLEIGSSGFPSYSFVRVDGTGMQSSFGPAREVAGTPLGRRLVNTYKGLEPMPRSQIGAVMDDGDCYFLTVYADGKAETTFAYGILPTLERNALIRELVETARAP